MAWLVRDGKVMATLEVAETAADRRRGLLGRDDLDGALLLKPCRAVHTVRMRFPIDVAFCGPPDDEGVHTVLAVRRMRPHRIGWPVWRARVAIEAEAGAFSRWGLTLGDRIEIR